MKNVLFALLTLIVTAVSHAADTKPIEDVFQNYWRAYAQQDFVRAAAQVLPSDLEAAKAAILPVFLAAQTPTNAEAKEIVRAFFGRTVGKARETMSAAEVFAGLNRVVVASNPNFFELLKQASTSVFYVHTPDAENAKIHFQVMFRGESDIDSEALRRANGRWWVRAKDDAKAVAAQFKEILARK